MRIAVLALAAAVMAMSAMPLIAHPGGQKHEQSNGNGHVDNPRDHRAAARPVERDRRDYSRYDYNRPDPRYGNYRADRYYVGGNQYKARRLDRNERIYRGADNRFYCRRSDGTTGLIIGGLAGGTLGNAIAPGGSKTLGTLLGGGLGALLGRSIDRDRGNVTCR
jgi:hypothetical protein